MKIQGNAGHQIIFHKKWSFIGQKVCGHVPQIFVNTCAMATSAEVALALFSNKWKANRKAATQLLFRLEMWNVVCALLFLFFFSFCSCPTPVAKGPPCHERVKNWTFNLKVHENLKQNFVHVAENRSVMSSIVNFFLWLVISIAPDSRGIPNMTAQSIWRTDFKSLTFWKPFSARPWLDNPWIKDPILYYIYVYMYVHTSIPQRTVALAQKSLANKFKNSNGSTPGQSRRVANLTCVESSRVELSWGCDHGSYGSRRNLKLEEHNCKQRLGHQTFTCWQLSVFLIMHIHHQTTTPTKNAVCTCT